MENLKLTRVDFRLIHGQVITRWVGRLSVTDITVIDDRTKKSPILLRVLLGAAPKGVNVTCYTLEEATEIWVNGEVPTGNLMILFRDCETAKKAWEAGIKFPSLQIGGTEGAGNKKNVYRNVVLSQEDFDAMKPLMEAGVRVYCQPIPEDAEYPLEDAAGKFK